ncbi:MAG: D-alanyl-D-alanine carboxypeptidase family protein [Cyanophyceae cyanobacterium]
MDEIPEALREQPSTAQSSRRGALIAVAALGLGAISVSGFLLLKPSPNEESAAAPPTGVPSAEPETEAAPEDPDDTSVDNLLGHLPYEEVPTSELVAVTPDGSIRLKAAAAEKFLQMQAAAQAEGIVLAPLSGFRSVAEQDYLFFGVKEQRGQGAAQRAEVSAPPGYSEHHTGYAIDIGDGRAPATHLTPGFEKTAAFRWLEQNAPRYSFELSFPRDNPQGISYEPWHWRFVGDSQSLKTFYKTKPLPSTTEK